MYQIKKAEFERLREQHPDEIWRCLITHKGNGRVCRAGEGHLVRGSVLTGDPGKNNQLLIEHIHFEITAEE